MIGRPRKFTRVIVHLGNVLVGHRTQKLVKRFPEFKFVGIDLKKIPASIKDSSLKNWTQINADFANGLRKIKDGTADVVSSDFSLGYYDKTGRAEEEAKDLDRYTKEVLNLAYHKLKPGGKMHLLVGEKQKKMIIGMLRKVPFRNVESSLVYYENLGRSYWMRAVQGRKFQISMEKPLGNPK